MPITAFFIPVSKDNWEDHAILMGLQIEENKSKMAARDNSENGASRYAKLFFKNNQLRLAIRRLELQYN